MAIVKKISELTAKGSNIGANDLVIVGVSNGTDYDLKSVTGNQLVGAAIAQTITSGVTTTAPSQDAVKTALDLKVDKVVGSRLITSAEGTKLSNLSGVNTGDQDLSGYQLTSGKDASSGYVGISAGNVITLPLGRGFISNNVTPNQIAYFDNSGNLLTLSVATYPSISELSYVKGVTSAIQTQINAKVTGSGTSSGTNTGDQIISDATITTTDITTNNFTTAKHGFVPKGTNVGNFLKDDGTWASAGGGSGVCGIANSSGVYTYYATLSLAIAAATSGQTIDILTNITETGSVTLLPTSGIRINGNGYTYTLSVNDGTHAFTWNYYNVELYNLKVVRTGRAANSSGVVFYKNDTGSVFTLKCQNVVFENTYGVGVSLNNSIISGLTINSYGDGVFSTFDSTALNNCIITSTAAYGVNLANSSYDIVNCNVVGITYGINNGGAVYNSIGKTTSGNGIQATRVANSTGISSSGTAMSSSNGYNCVGISTSGVGLSGTFTNSTGISTSGYAGSGGTKTNCTLISSSNYGSFQENLNNTFLQSTTNVPMWLSTGKLVNECTAICLWDNASGHAINTTSAATGVDIRNSSLTVTNASAYCINGASASTFKYANNSFKGSTVAVNATNITQGITNLSDTKGNILI